jgi:hypothetical protein
MRMSPPLLSDGPHDLLDHVELRALTDPDKNSSASELTSDLKVTGSSDAIDEQQGESLSEYREAVLDAVFTEAEYRLNACGEANYPFSIDGKALLSRDDSSSTVYTFLLLLSLFGKDAVAGTNAAKLFEDVCAYATAKYFGYHELLAKTYVFGFPRRMAPKDFVGALKDLCRNKILEGEADTKFPGARFMKDASLDIVSWLPFPDGRSGKLIAFGQCATGRKWWDKRTELNPYDWIRAWLTKTPQVVPVKMFFVPHAITENEWAQLGYAAGIIFDRFRIAHLAEQSIPEPLRAILRDWSNAVCADEG